MITRKERLPHGFLSFSASVLGGELGFTWKPAYYSGTIDNLGAGFVYYEAGSGDTSLPTKGTSVSTWLYVFTFGRGDGFQLAYWNHDTRLAIRSGSISSHTWDSWSYTDFT